MKKEYKQEDIFIEIKNIKDIYKKNNKTVNCDLVIKDSIKPATIDNLVFMKTQVITSKVLDCGKDLYNKIGPNLYSQTYEHMYNNSLESAIGSYDINSESSITNLMKEKYQLLNYLYDNSNYQEMLKCCDLCIKLFIIMNTIEKVEYYANVNSNVKNHCQYTDENKRIKDDKLFPLKLYINNALPNKTDKITYGIIEKAAIAMFTDIGRLNNIPDTINDTYFDERTGKVERKLFHKSYISAIYDCIDRIILKTKANLKKCKYCGYYLITSDSKVKYHTVCYSKYDSERHKK